MSLRPKKMKSGEPTMKKPTRIISSKTIDGQTITVRRYGKDRYQFIRTTEDGHKTVATFGELQIAMSVYASALKSMKGIH